MRFAIRSLLASALAFGPIVASAAPTGEPSAAMRVADVAAEALKEKGTCDDKSVGAPSAAMRVADVAAEALDKKGTCDDCPDCAKGTCDKCAKGTCDKCAKGTCDQCAKGTCDTCAKSTCDKCAKAGKHDGHKG